MRKTISQLVEQKVNGEKITMITCYDSTFARIIDECEIDTILIGDSGGNTMLGYDSTLPVTVENIIAMTAAVVRGNKSSFIVADMPFMSYHVSPEDAVINAGRLVKEGGAQAVKLEGGAEFTDVIAKITRAQIPVVAHLGLTPQSVNAFGGYKVQAKTSEAIEKLVADSLAVQEAGARMLVLEGVPAEVATHITSLLSIPTIGIGAGEQTDGQVLVLQDMLGLNETVPKFVKKYAGLRSVVIDAIKNYDSEVKSTVFPSAEYSYTLPPGVQPPQKKAKRWFGND
jgi:3-methyl-2-oxobutanoate hydroxymethyltransferase